MQTAFRALSKAPVVNLSVQLEAELAALTLSLDDPNVDLQRSLEGLAEHVKLAITSFIGVSMSVTTAGRPITISALDEGADLADIRSSLMVRIGQPENTDPASQPIEAIFYAAALGAFVDLAADLAWIISDSRQTFPLDSHLDGAALRLASSGISGLTLINQALGVLIGRGHTPEQAQVELDELSDRAEVDRSTAASFILNDRADPD